MSDALPLAPPPPAPRFSIAVTGHQKKHASFVAGPDHLIGVLTAIFENIDASVTSIAPHAATTRLHTLLADGADQIAATLALGRGYDLHCPLPFGRRLNAAINCHSVDRAEAESIISEGIARTATTVASLSTLDTLAAQAHLFELAERDGPISALFLQALAQPDDSGPAKLFHAEASMRVAAAGQILVEQADLLIAWWDGTTSAPVGVRDACQTLARQSQERCSLL